ncbi:hypothetical protein CR513_47317, partial [Mucuna pruriens]
MVNPLSTPVEITHFLGLCRRADGSDVRIPQLNQRCQHCFGQPEHCRAGYAIGPYGWNIENPVNEEQEQQIVVNNNKVGLVVNISSRAGPNDGVGPNTEQDLGAKHWASWNVAPFSLEERLDAIEGGDKYGLEVVDLCLVLDVGLPIDFKTLEFDKYKGSSYPRVHLAMYCWKMAAYIYDDKVLIHCFQDNQTGATFNWYVSLEQGHIKTWRDLTKAFLK